MVLITIVFMGFISQLITGGPHIIGYTIWLFNITMERSTHFLSEKSTISMVMFNSYVSHYQRIVRKRQENLTVLLR